MDRNFFTAIFLMLLLTTGYYYFLSQQPQPLPPTETLPENVDDTQSSPVDEVQPQESLTEISDSNRIVELQDRYSDFYLLIEGEDQTIEVKTDELTIHISNKGGNIKGVWLNNHKTFDSLPLPLIRPHEENDLNFQFAYKGGRIIKSDELFFTPSANSISLSGDEQKILSMKAEIAPGKGIEQRYTFKGDKFDFEYEIIFEGLDDGMKNNFYEMNWKSVLPKTELSLSNMRQTSTIAYRVSDDVEKLSASDELEQETVKTRMSWISYKSHFFSTILIAEDGFSSGELTMTTPETDESVNRVMESNLYVDLKQDRSKFSFYVGPNEYATLQSYDQKLEKEMDLGWSIISYINIGTVYIFKFLEKYISNYGFIIIILACIIRFMLFPLTFKSHVSMAKMRVINQTPEMKELDKKYKEEPQKLKWQR